MTVLLLMYLLALGDAVGQDGELETVKRKEKKVEVSEVSLKNYKRKKVVLLCLGASGGMETAETSLR